ncbi:MAG: hypothetical protein WA705_10895 [Candidatus Ozemobacteraceae bacterium]
MKPLVKRESHDSWEEKFIAICEKQLEEEPLYPYEHLYKKGLSPRDAFEEYLVENPDYAEKFEEGQQMIASPAPDSKTDSREKGLSAEEQAKNFLELAKKLEAKRAQQQIEKLQVEVESLPSKYCPNCARTLSKKGPCKCGYKRPSAKSRVL